MCFFAGAFLGITLEFWTCNYLKFEAFFLNYFFYMVQIVFSWSCLVLNSKGIPWSFSGWVGIVGCCRWPLIETHYVTLLFNVQPYRLQSEQVKQKANSPPESRRPNSKASKAAPSSASGQSRGHSSRRYPSFLLSCVCLWGVLCH